MRKVSQYIGDLQLVIWVFHAILLEQIPQTAQRDNVIHRIVRLLPEQFPCDFTSLTREPLVLNLLHRSLRYRRRLRQDKSVGLTLFLLVLLLFLFLLLLLLLVLLLLLLLLLLLVLLNGLLLLIRVRLGLLLNLSWRVVVRRWLLPV
ncbi:hypothetical protein D2E89_00690 [Mycobacteroides abscessus]|nr:hypothetical protein D2E89_00690 [Mycobacteroides abscessus]